MHAAILQIKVLQQEQILSLDVTLWNKKDHTLLYPKIARIHVFNSVF